MISVLSRQLRGRALLLIACEHGLIVAAVVLGAWVRLDDAVWTLFLIENGLAKAVFIGVACQLCLYYADLYDLRSIKDRRDLFIRIVQAVGGTSVLLAAVYFWVPSLIIGRGVFL